MSSTKQYAYYIEGNKYAIVEKDVTFDNDVTSKEYGPGASRSKWVSPKTSEADALKVKYVYSKNYRLANNQSESALNMYWGHADGYLRIADLSDVYFDWTSILNVGDYFVLENAEKFNGLHKATGFESSTGSNNVIVTDILYEKTVSILPFEETPLLYYNVSTLEDESFDIDLPSYLQKALVYYIKAKLAEDAGELKLREYAMREFKKMIEKHESLKISGIRITVPGSHAIR